MFRIISVFFLSVCFSCLQAQNNYTVNQTFLANERINIVSAGSENIWAVTGIDSLGLVMLDSKGITTDYSSQTRSMLPKPIKFLVATYRKDAIIGTEDNLYRISNGVISKIDKTSAGIGGTKILGLEFNKEKFRVATNTGLYQSYDNLISYNGNERLDSPIYGQLLGLAYINQTNGPRCYDTKKATTALIYAESGIYVAHLPFDSSAFIYDFGFSEKFNGQTYAYPFFAGTSKGLTVTNWGCGQTKSFLNNQRVYSLKSNNDTMFIGTENGLYLCRNTYIPDSLIHYTLGFNQLAVYSIAFDLSKGFLWLGTDKGLIRLVKKQNKESFSEITSIEEPTNWVASITGKSIVNAAGVTTDIFGNTLVTGYFKGQIHFGDTSLVANNGQDYFLASYNKNGKLNWVKSALTKTTGGYELNDKGDAVVTDKQGNIYSLFYAGVFSADLPESLTVTIANETIAAKPWQSVLIKYDNNGNALWTRILGRQDANDKTSLKVDLDGNIYILTTLFSDNNFSLPEGKAMAKYSPTGAVLWKKSVPGTSIFAISKAGVLISGIFDRSITFGKITLNSNQDYSAFIFSLDQNGNTLWGNYIGRSSYEGNSHIVSVMGIATDASGNVYMNGFAYGSIMCDAITTKGPADLGKPFYYVKLNPNGKCLFAKKTGNDTPQNQWQRVSSFSVDSTGFSASYGMYSDTWVTENQTITAAPNVGYATSYSYYALKRDPNGKLLYLKNFINNTFNNPVIYPDSKGNIAGAINTSNSLQANNSTYINQGLNSIFIFSSTDTTSTYKFNTVRGKIFDDKNNNKIFDGNDAGIAGVIVKAVPGDVYAQSDLQGNYTMYLPKGNYTVEQVISNRLGLLMNQVWPANNGKLPLKLVSNTKDTSNFDFINKTTYVAYLNVDINSIRRRRCFRGSTTVKYCNDGFADAHNVKLKVEFPEYVIPISSDIPWSSKEGKNIFYNIGTVPMGTCATITIADSVQCGDEAIIGQTQCTKVYITPSNNLVPADPKWDQSQVKVTGSCLPYGYVRTTIKNIGKGNMTDSTHVRVFLNTSIVLQKSYKLAVGDSISTNFRTDGKTLRIEATQTALNPNPAPSVLTIEGCIATSNSNVQSKISTGIVNQFPMNTEEEEVKTSCLPIIGSFDPNDKQVFPSGITENHNIAENTELEYVLRFQNSGNDTAFTVIVADTLSTFLDITSFKAGVTSHPCIWNISGKEKPVLTCTFNKIYLPDSTTNELRSHGFVKFRIKPVPDITGQQIKNKGYIYFDYNEAVVTNEVINTIGLPPFVKETVTVQHCSSQQKFISDSSYIHICGINEVKLPVSRKDTVFTNWLTLQGSGNISTQVYDTVQITSLPYGINRFAIKNQYCDAVWYNTFTINRNPVPAALPDTLIKYCEDQILDSIYIQGKGVAWYDSQQTVTLLAQGNKYLPAYGTDQNLYINQYIDNCAGKRSLVQIDYTSRPAPPVTNSGTYCHNSTPKQVSAEGQQIIWYSDTLAFKKISNGNIFTKNDLAQGDSLHVFATQNVLGCESTFSSASLYVKKYNLESVFVPNVISFAKQQSFYLPHQITNECIGQFSHVRVSDVSGKELFYSEEESFIWNPVAIQRQLLLFQIKFSDHIYKGKLIVGE